MLGLLKKSLLVAFFILIYFLIIIPIRNHLAYYIYNYLSVANLDTFFFKLQGRILVLGLVDSIKVYPLKMPYDITFFISSIAFILQNNWKYLGLLTIIPLTGFVIALIFLLIGIHQCINILLIPIDLIGRYMVPLCSLGLVALAYIQQKEEAEE